MSSATAVSTSGLWRSIRDRLAGARDVLLIGVGGGNDSVTSLLLAAQLERDYGFRPRRLQVAAMLPDVLTYERLREHPSGLFEVTPEAVRRVGYRQIREFPEPLLSAHRDRFGIERVVGLPMSGGTEGLYAALHEAIAIEGFDLVLAADVGGDFIAVPENLEVLSPMMDAYALSALRRLQEDFPGTPFLYAVFGLGTDGESTPAMLGRALESVGKYVTGVFDPETIRPVETFYRKVIEPNRRSRTADFTLRGIHGEPLEPTLYRARFHTRPSPGEARRYYGEFMHAFDPEFAGKYYLFEELTGVRNPFEQRCRHGLEWFRGIQRLGPGLNHELNGQSYSTSVGSILLGTPSFRFTSEQRAEIVRDTAGSVESGVFDAALIARRDGDLVTAVGVQQVEVDEQLNLLCRDRSAGPLIEELQALSAPGREKPDGP